MPGTGTLRTLAGFTDPVAAALLERITSVDAETMLRTTVDRLRTFDLAHLQDIHRRLFGDVYEWAGQLRDIDLSKPDQTGGRLLHDRWITVYSSAVVDQLQAGANLAGQSDSGIWADRVAHYWVAMLHAHPFPRGQWPQHPHLDRKCGRRCRTPSSLGAQLRGPQCVRRRRGRQRATSSRCGRC